MKYLEDYINRKELNIMIEAGYVSCSQHGVLRIYNYTKHTQYEKRWNDVTLKCRGLITEEVNGKEVIKAIPMKKFFNLNELDPKTRKEVASAKYLDCYDKIDGCLMIMFEYNGELWLSTRGNMESPMAKKATKFLRNQEIYEDLKTIWKHEFKDKYTLLFEYTSPEFVICLDYGLKDALTFLGAVDMETGHFSSYDKCLGEPLNSEFLGLWNNHKTRKVTAHQIVLDDEMPDFFVGSHSLMNRENAEGFVCRTGDKIFKLKQEDYLELSRMKQGITYGYLIDLVARAHNRESVMHAILDAEISQIDDLEEYIIERAEPYRTQYEEILTDSKKRYGELLTMLSQLDIKYPDNPTEEQWKEYNNQLRIKFFEEVKRDKYKGVVVALYDKQPEYQVAQTIKRYIKPVEVEDNEFME